MGLRIYSNSTVKELTRLAIVGGSFDAGEYGRLVDQYRSAYARKGSY